MSDPSLADENARLREEVRLLKEQLAQTRVGTEHTSNGAANDSCSHHGPSGEGTHHWGHHSLSKAQVERYSRHLLLSSFGLQPQERVCKGSVLVVGCGGLGSPASLYLAAAGVGKLGLVDHDTVDVSNLHRQVIHPEARVGAHKALSAAQSCRALNSQIQVVAHTEGLTPANALGIISGYDAVVDATDNPATRYLISDACVVARKPLVSAAAVGTDGQLTVYCHGQDGPCYRCLFPESPAPENCSRCADAGVLGPVPGVMGVLQAVEAIKVLSGVGDVMSRKLLIYDALAARFTTIKLRGRQPDCVACGDSPQITLQSLPAYDYVLFTGQAPTDGPPVPLTLIPEQERVTPAELQALMAAASSSSPGATSITANGGDAPAAGSGKVAVLDVRPATQYALLQHPCTALHVPFEQLEKQIEQIKSLAVDRAAASSFAASGTTAAASGSDVATSKQGAAASALQDPAGVVYVLCRRGNNSQRAVALLRQHGINNVVDVVGGIEGWAKEVDTSMPVI